MSTRYDRASEDVGNLVLLEHVNVTHPDQRLATLFYVEGLGGTRDPYLMVGVDNMWVNFGRTQMHLPTRPAQRLRGTMGFIVPDLPALERRFERISTLLTETAFAYRSSAGCVEATCPWGNRLRCHAPTPEFAGTELGLVYVDFDVPAGTAEGIARFYTQVMRAPARAAAGRASVAVGNGQFLRFSETRAPLPAYDGHHIQVYIAGFSGPYAWLAERQLITLEADAHEWRFRQIVDPQTDQPLFEIEHEVRSLKHPLYARPLVNRNPEQSNTRYVRGHDGFGGTY